MITDALNTFCDNTPLNTGAAGAYNLGDVIDLVATSRAIIDQDDLYLVFTMNQSATSGGAATAEFQLVTDDNSGMASPVVLASTGPRTLAQLATGQIVGVLALPKGAAYERYIGVRQVTAVAAFTAGQVNAFLTPTPQTWVSVADGLTKL